MRTLRRTLPDHKRMMNPLGTQMVAGEEKVEGGGFDPYGNSTT